MKIFNSNKGNTVFLVNAIHRRTSAYAVWCWTLKSFKPTQRKHSLSEPVIAIASLKIIQIIIPRSELVLDTELRQCIGQMLITVKILRTENIFGGYDLCGGWLVNLFGWYEREVVR